MTINKITLDVTTIEPKLKHPTIFQYFDKLSDGEGFIIHNDHDPKPLYYQLLAERGQVFKWTYLEDGPTTWRVEITKKLDKPNTETLASLSAADFRKAEVFKKFGLNFSCHGKQSLEEACNDKNINIDLLKNELNAIASKKSDSPDYQSWSLTLLIQFIKHSHHIYVKNHLPELVNICQFLNSEFQNVTMSEINSLCQLLNHELLAHINKEEIILFPYILQLQKQVNNNEVPLQKFFDSINTPINMMLIEHESSDDIIAKMNELILNIPSEIQNNMQFHIFCDMFKKFKDDLMTHIHLENNILFPKAIELEKQCLLINPN